MKNSTSVQNKCLWMNPFIQIKTTAQHIPLHVLMFAL